MDGPCRDENDKTKDCPDRYPGCSSWRPKYKVFRDKLDKANNARFMENQIDSSAYARRNKMYKNFHSIKGVR